MKMQILIKPTGWCGRPEVIVRNGLDAVLWLYVTHSGELRGWSCIGTYTFNTSERDARWFLNHLVAEFAMFATHELEEAA